MNEPLTQEQIVGIINRYKSVFPVPVGKIANQLGIKIISTRGLAAGLSGSITKEDGQYYIYVNSRHSPLRQRFTIAHELAHYVNHRDYLDKQHEIVNHSKKPLPVALNRPDRGPNAASTPTTRAYELEADDFAAKLLMPETEFKRTWRSSSIIDDIISKFGVSAAAINVRGYNLGLGYFE